MFLSTEFTRKCSPFLANFISFIALLEEPTLKAFINLFDLKSMTMILPFEFPQYINLPLLN